MKRAEAELLLETAITYAADQRHHDLVHSGLDEREQGIEMQRLYAAFDVARVRVRRAFDAIYSAEPRTLH